MRAAHVGAGNVAELATDIIEKGKPLLTLGIFTSNLATPNIADFNGFFPALTRSASSSEVQVGFSAGGALEWAFDPRWTFKAEYIYINLGKSNGNALASPGASFRDTEVQLHTAKGDINYRF